MSTQLNVNDIRIQYQDFLAVDRVSFQLTAGHIACLLGPSGCGKTSILRAIAGFEPITDGEITLGERRVAAANFSMPPQDRRVGMVFQDFALYPHLTVAENVAFGLNKQAKTERDARVNDLLTLVHLQDIQDRYPHEISGGQQQRVALIRAMAPKPDILLLDEPFSNMDLALRDELCHALRETLKADHATAIMVTHDQKEAFAIADEIGVINQGKLAQWGSAQDLYERPNNAFVAGFIGQSTLLSAKKMDDGFIETALGKIKAIPTQYDNNAPISVQVRPEDIEINDTSPVKATVVRYLFLGPDYLYTLQLPNGETIISKASAPINLDKTHTVGVRIKAKALHTFSH